MSYKSIFKKFYEFEARSIVFNYSYENDKKRKLRYYESYKSVNIELNHFNQLIWVNCECKYLSRCANVPLDRWYKIIRHCAYKFFVGAQYNLEVEGLFVLFFFYNSIHLQLSERDSLAFPQYIYLPPHIFLSLFLQTCSVSSYESWSVYSLVHTCDGV